MLKTPGPCQTLTWEAQPQTKAPPQYLGGPWSPTATAMARCLLATARPCPWAPAPTALQAGTAAGNPSSALFLPRLQCQVLHSVNHICLYLYARTEIFELQRADNMVCWHFWEPARPVGQQWDSKWQQHHTGFKNDHTDVLPTGSSGS